jgi:glycerol-1-phosphate dehydrogenase [NAD(P)+]
MALYEYLLRMDLHSFDIEAAVRAWPALAVLEERIHTLFGPGALEIRAKEETRAKYVSAETLRIQLKRLQENWGELRSRLTAQLIPFRDLRDMLRRAGCPFDPGQIGISRERLRLSYQQCCWMRRRFTVLDLVLRLGVIDTALDQLFSSQGLWSPEGEDQQ